MPYFRVDDGWWSHPKTMALSDAAQALWVRSGAWSMEHYTDGLIPANALAILRAKPKAIRELVDVGYWSAVLPGFQFHDWDQYQETAESLKTRRDKNKERMRAVRAHNANTNDARAGERAQTVRDAIPSHPIPTTGLTGEASVLETGGTRTDEVEPPAEFRERASRFGVDFDKVWRTVSKQRGEIVPPRAVLKGIVLIIGRAKAKRGDRTGLILSSLHSDWAEWQQLIDEEAAA